MPGIRGCLSAMLKVLGHVGVLLSYIAGTYLNWRQSALLVAIAPSMLFLGTLFIPETPSYLVLNGKDDEAANSLQWLRGDHVDIRHELQVILQRTLYYPLYYRPIEERSDSNDDSTRGGEASDSIDLDGHHDERSV